MEHNETYIKTHGEEATIRYWAGCSCGWEDVAQHKTIKEAYLVLDLHRMDKEFQSLQKQWHPEVKTARQKIGAFLSQVVTDIFIWVTLVLIASFVVQPYFPWVSPISFAWGGIATVFEVKAISALINL